MKKYFNTAFFYLFLGLAGGIFYREFTKFNGFSGQTSLGFLHLHLLVLGMFFFLILCLMEKVFEFSQGKKSQAAFMFYNLGLLITAAAFVGRGIPQVLSISLSKAADASLSGAAGIGHIVLGTGFVLYFLALRKKMTATEGGK